MYKEKHILNKHYGSHKLSRYIDVYETTLQTDGHGTISASKLTGYAGDNVVLSATPNQYYAFDNYTLTGASITGDTSGVTNLFILCQGCSKLTSICLLNTSNATSLRGMFWECTSLTSLPQFDTSNVTDIHDLCYGCTALTYVPLFNTSKVTNVNYMFYNCKNVRGGALALYQQMSTQQNPPSNHLNCFRNCGSNTQTGSAELAQIPASWK